MKRVEQSPSDLWDDTRRFTVCIIRLPEKGECSTEEIFDGIRAKKIPRFGTQVGFILGMEGSTLKNSVHVIYHVNCQKKN